MRLRQLSTDLSAIESTLKTIEDEVTNLKQQIAAAATSWLDHHMISLPPNAWHAHTEVPPEGMLWASDGLDVWIIYSNGQPIRAYETEVKYWSIVLIPFPPMTNRPDEKADHLG